jgi:hypothetical protein
MKLGLAAILFLLVTTSVQAVTIGAISSGGLGVRALQETSIVTTIVNSAYPATEAGTVSRATVMWVSGPNAGPNGTCENAFELKFLRPSTSGPFSLTVIAERGPFNAEDGSNVLTLTPPVAIQPGDMIGVTELRGFLSCGGTFSASADQTLSYFIAESDPALGAPITNMQIDHGLIPGIRASSEADVVHGHIPVVGSLTGAFGSRFKTAVQLTNLSRGASTGKLVFHPAGTAASPADPSLEFALLNPKQTIAFDDIVDQMGRSGLGTMDLVVTDGPPPDVTVAVFDDQGAAGTSGFTTEVLTPSQALQEFSNATLTTPSDPANFRLNIGIRTLGSGATVRFSAANASGATVAQGTFKTFPANYFEQNNASVYLGGAPVPPNGTITVFVQDGTAFVYGATTDNRTNDARFRLFQKQ